MQRERCSGPSLLAGRGKSMSKHPLEKINGSVQQLTDGSSIWVPQVTELHRGRVSRWSISQSGKKIMKEVCSFLLLYRKIGIVFCYSHRTPVGSRQQDLSCCSAARCISSGLHLLSLHRSFTVLLCAVCGHNQNDEFVKKNSLFTIKGNHRLLSRVDLRIKMVCDLRWTKKLGDCKYSLSWGFLWGLPCSWVLFILNYSVCNFTFSDLCWGTRKKFDYKGQQGCSYENSSLRGPVYTRQGSISAEFDSRRNSFQNKGPYSTSKYSMITCVPLHAWRAWFHLFLG